MARALEAPAPGAFERVPEVPSEGTTTSLTQVERFRDGYLVAGDRQWDGPASWIFVRTDRAGRARWLLEPNLTGRAWGPADLRVTEDGQSALAVGTPLAREAGSDRYGLAIELFERCD